MSYHTTISANILLMVVNHQTQIRSQIALNNPNLIQIPLYVIIANNICSILKGLF